MKRGAMMKARILLVSLIFMLLAFPAAARSVSFAVLTEGDLAGGVPNDLKSLDALIDVKNKDISEIFEYGNFLLQSNQELVIKGGRDSIESELEKYKDVKGKNSKRDRWITSAQGALEVYACYIKQMTAMNVTYVMIRTQNFNSGKTHHCDKRLYPSTSGNPSIILVPALAKSVGKLK